MVSIEETQAKISYEAAVYRQQLAILQKEIEQISKTSTELSKAASTVENIRKSKVFIPLGGGSYLKGAVTDTNVLVPVGANYVVEMESDEAGREMKRRIDATKTAIERLATEFKKIATKLRAASEQLKRIEETTEVLEKVEESSKEDYI